MSAFGMENMKLNGCNASLSTTVFACTFAMFFSKYLDVDFLQCLCVCVCTHVKVVCVCVYACFSVSLIIQCKDFFVCFRALCYFCLLVCLDPKFSLVAFLNVTMPMKRMRIRKLSLEWTVSCMKFMLTVI